MYERTDGWFICIAPLENPQLAIAVVVEEAAVRFGAHDRRADRRQRDIKGPRAGLLGDQYKPKAPAPTPAAKRKRK